VPKIAKKLKPSDITKLVTDGKYAVGGVPGLYIRIAGNSRAWVLSVACGKRVNAKGDLVVRRLNLGLGSVKEISLSNVRKKAAEIKLGIKAGVDPIVQKRNEIERQNKEAFKRVRFEQCAGEYIENKQKEWSNEKHRNQWVNTLNTYVHPLIGRRIVSSITTGDIYNVLTQKINGTTFWESRTETASRVRGRIAAIMDFAIAKGIFDGANPADWERNLKFMLPAPGKIKTQTHYEALRFSDIPALVKRLCCSCVRPVHPRALALLFIVLTVVRTKELRFSIAGEFRLNDKLWKIPAARMKRKRDFTVPLSNQSITILNSLNIAELGENDFVFRPENNGSYAYSENALLGELRLQGCKVETVHGLRSSFKEWCREIKGNEYQDEVSELSLAHVNSDKTRSAYARDQLVKIRARLMQEWSDFCFSECCTSCSTIIGGCVFQGEIAVDHRHF
jgi:integrase